MRRIKYAACLPFITASLAIAGCSSTGSNTPTPTPAPAPSPTPAPTPAPGYEFFGETAAAANYAAGTTTFVAQDSADIAQGTFGQGMVSYNPATDSYTLTAPDASEVTVGPDDYLDSLSNANVDYWSVLDDTIRNDVGITTPKVNGVNLLYTKIIGWGQVQTVDDEDTEDVNEANSATGNAVTFITGVPTLVSEIPTTGTANFDVEVFGAGQIDDTDVVFSSLDTATTGSFEINFGTGAISTDLHLFGTPQGETDEVDLGSFTGLGAMDVSSPLFDGTFTGPDAGTGSFVGSLFGPNGQEMGYGFQLEGGTYDFGGYVVGSD
jgi:hypothetical protein